MPNSLCQSRTFVKKLTLSNSISPFELSAFEDARREASGKMSVLSQEIDSRSVDRHIDFRAARADCHFRRDGKSPRDERPSVRSLRVAFARSGSQSAFRRAH